MTTLGFPKRNKFSAVKIKDGARTYDSKLEAAVGQILHLREKAKEISDIKHQVVVHLTRAQISYRADYSFFDVKTKSTVHVEAKGVEGERWRVIKNLWKFYGPTVLEIWKGTAANPLLAEVIIPRDPVKSEGSLVKCYRCQCYAQEAIVLFNVNGLVVCHVCA